MTPSLRALKLLGWFRFSSGAWASPPPGSQWFPDFESAWAAAANPDPDRLALDAVAALDPSLRHNESEWRIAAREWLESKRN